MEKFMLELELTLYAGDVKGALEKFTSGLEQVVEKLRHIPPEVFEDLSQPSGGITGEPPGKDDLGWRCLYSISKPKD